MAAAGPADPAKFAFWVAAGCEQIMAPLLGLMERAAATGHHLAFAAAAALALLIVPGYFAVVARAFALCVARRR